MTATQHHSPHRAGKRAAGVPNVWRTLVVALSLVTLSAASAAAQIDTASIVGTVRDTSGAVLPGVTVTATLEDSV